MKKAKHRRSDDLRAKYVRSDFPEGFVRGKYAARIAASSNIVRLEPEVAAAFPTSEAVNDGLPPWDATNLNVLLIPDRLLRALLDTTIELRERWTRITDTCASKR